MLAISRNGRSVAGFGLAAPPTVGVGSVAGAVNSYAFTAAMTGSAAGLLAYVLGVPTWTAVAVGGGAGIFTYIVATP